MNFTTLKSCIWFQTFMRLEWDPRLSASRLSRTSQLLVRLFKKGRNMKSSSVCPAPRKSLPHGLRTIMIKVVDQPYNEGACQCSEIQKDLNTYWTEIFPLLKFTTDKWFIEGSGEGPEVRWNQNQKFGISLSCLKEKS